MALVLVIEDRRADRELLVKLLTHRGYQVAEAVNGKEGLRLTRELRPDLVIADMLVPEMDGLDYARAVRVEPEIAHTPIVLYTATYQPWELERLARAAGVTRVLEKPAEPHEILATVQKALAHAA